MEIRNNNSFDDFDPTPRLKSSPVPILFIPFNNNENKCSYCGNEYSMTTYIYGYEYRQKYCKNCLFWYIKYITDNNKYLDVEINTKKNAQCIIEQATKKRKFYNI